MIRTIIFLMLLPIVAVAQTRTGPMQVQNGLAEIAAGGAGAQGTARTSLGLGSIATQGANAVNITGGSAAGLTSLGVTGNSVTVGGNAAAPVITLNGAANSARGINIKAAGTTRWDVKTDASDDLQFFAYAPGSGAFINTAFGFSTANLQVKFGWTANHSVNVSTMPALGAVGEIGTYTNTSGTVGQGRKHTYFSNATTAGFDLGATNIIVPTATSGFPVSGTTTYQGNWTVALSPNESSGTQHWATTGMELDVVNRGADQGWSAHFNQVNAVAGFLAVPESTTFGQGGNTYNALAAFVAHASAAAGTSGLTNRWHNGFLCDSNAMVGGTGRCLYATGDVTGLLAQYPYAPAGFAGNWLHGIDVSAATFDDGHALVLGAGQSIAWPAAAGNVTGLSNGSLSMAYAGTGEIDLRDPAGNVRAKMNSTAVDLGVSGTGTNFRVNNTVTNLVSTDVSGYTGSGNTVTNNSAVAPDGNTTAALMTTATSNVGQTRFKSFSGVNGTLYSGTVYAKTVPGSSFPYVGITFANTGFGGGTFGIVVNTTTCAFSNNINALGGNAPASFSTIAVGGGWCRVNITQRSTGGTPWVFTVGNAQGFTMTFLGDGTGIYVWQPVVEAVPENFVTATGAVAGSVPSLSAANSADTNVDINLAPKGSGTIRVGGTAGVSCAANTVSLTTLVVTNGIITHC